MLYIIKSKLKTLKKKPVILVKHIIKKIFSLKYSYYKYIGNLTKAKKVVQRNKKIFNFNNKLCLQFNIVNTKLEMLDDNSLNSHIEYIKKNNVKVNNKEYKPQNKKILHVLNSCAPYKINGYSVRFEQVSSTIKEFGYSQAVITKPGFPANYGIMKNEGKHKVEEINGIKYYWNNLDVSEGATPFNEFIELFVSSIIEVALIEKPAILHAASNYVMGVAALIAADLLNIPFVYEVRGRWELTKCSNTPQYNGSDDYRFSQKMEQYAMKYATKVITLSNALKDYIIKEGIPSNKIAVIQNCINLSKVSETTHSDELLDTFNIRDKFVIGYAGAIVKYEGLQTAIIAIKQLVNKGVKNICFIIIGSGNYLEVLKKLVHKNSLNPYIKFVGRVLPDKMPQYYSLFDICILPREDVEVCKYVPPIKPFECMAYGKAVIASELPVFNEFINNDNGRIYGKTPEQLSILLEEFIAQPSKALQLGISAKKWLYQNHHHTQILYKYKKIYQDIL